MAARAQAVDGPEPGTVAAPRPWSLYLLECAGGKLYAGISPDPLARFEKHKAGTGARYTRANKPLRILAVEQFLDRSSASIAEYQLKQCSPQAKRVWAQARPWQAPVACAKSG